MGKRKGMRSSWGFLVLLLLLLGTPLVGMAKSTAGGYLAVFDPVARPGEDLRLVALTRLAAVPGARLAELDGRNDWHLRYLDDAGEVIGDLSVPEPGAPLRGAAGTRVPLVLRIPDRSGAILVEVLDASRRRVAQVPLDAAARDAAAKSAARATSLHAPESTQRSTHGISAARADEAREGLHRQMEAAAVRAEQPLHCEGETKPWTPPETIRSVRACGASSAHAHAKPAVASFRPTGSARDARHGLSKHVAEASAPQSATVLLEGRVRFPAGVTAPDAPLLVDVSSANGFEQLVVVPPNFAYSAVVPVDSPVSLNMNGPPAPFLPAVRQMDAVLAGTKYDLTLRRGHLLSGRLQIPAGVASPDYAYFYVFETDQNGMELPARSAWAWPPDFEFAIGLHPGASVDVFVPSFPPLVSSRFSLGTPSADIKRNIPLQRGVTVTGRLLTPHGSPPINGSIYLDLTGVEGNVFAVANPPDHRYEFLARKDSMPTVRVTSPAPYLNEEIGFGPLVRDVTRDIRLQRGVSLTHHIRSNGSPAPTSITWKLLDLVSGGSNTQWLSVSGDFLMAVPPAGAVVELHADGYRASSGVVPRGGVDQTAIFELEPLSGVSNVELDLRGGQDQPLDQARVEIWRDGRYFVGVLADYMGKARLELADGNYQVRVWPDSEEFARYGGNYTQLFADPPIDVPLVVSGQTRLTLRTDAQNWLTMMVALPNEASWPNCNEKHGRLELLREGRVVARGRFRPLLSDDEFGHALTTGSGTYTLRYQMPGGVSYTSAPFVARNSARISLHRDGTAPQNRWAGTLRDHLGNLVPRRKISVSDEMGILTRPNYCPIATDDAGRFDLPICEGCVFEFQASTGSPSQRRIVRMDQPVTGSRTGDLQLGQPLVFAPLAASGTSRIFGRGDEPIKLVFLAEGYVSERETFTDSNGNGIWDGVQVVDLNRDGVYNDGEPYALYGNAANPVDGQDPRAISEVIQDLNGDGVLSLDDRALFERNVQDYLRGLFSSHQFSNYRSAYQASAVMAYSRQAGMDHGASLFDTAFSASYDPGRGLIDIDYSLASQVAAEVSPDHTVVVVMINQPVPYGRVNSFILAGGGVLASGVNDDVAAHEFGHNPGRLADEYAEFNGIHTGLSDSWFSNTTRFVDRDKVWWGDSVPEHQDGRPTRPWMASTGLFEGSSYYASGMFRPSQSSMMRYMDSLLFNEPSVRQLGLVHGRALRGRSGLLTVNPQTADCRSFQVSWNTGSLGISGVELRRSGPEGEVVATGGASGSATLKSHPGDLFLMDAATGVVIDVEGEPMLRCAQSSSSTPAAPARVRPPSAARPVPLPGMAQGRGAMNETVR